MALHDELVALEKQGWQGLLTGSTAARDFYGEILEDAAVILFQVGA